MSLLMKHTDSEQALIALLPQKDSARALREKGLPGRRTEDWRWSDLRGALKGPVALSDSFAGSEGRGLETQDALVFVFGNGRLLSSPDQLPDHVHYSAQVDQSDTVGTVLPQLAASLVDQTHHLTITGNADRPIHVRYLSDGTGMHQTRIRVDLDAGASATLIEEFVGGDQPWLSNSLSEFSLGEEARLTRIVLQAAAPAAVTVNTCLLNLQASSQFHQTALAFGGRLTRLETRATHQADGAEAHINGAYLLDGQNHLDFTTHVLHSAEECATSEIYKGVLTDASRGVFQGKFHVARGAQKTDARMAHHALLLSDTAEVNAKPELEIYADDVECAHGNTAGALDDNALFYMRQRGLSENQARAILVDAFVGEVLEQVEDEALREQLVNRVTAFMESAA
ncbi:MAG: Fe-S cluster assembly protein SufD [Aquisalinus sp.]|nr:Fe-S cluster assembly protein SufD [Aquisalinus sp.]